MANPAYHKRDLYSEVTARILAELETGAAPWVKSWSATPGLNHPHNAATDRPFRSVEPNRCAGDATSAFASCGQLPRRTGFDFASARPNYDRCSTFFHGRTCIRQIAILTVELIGHIAVSSANPAVIKAANCKRPTIGKH
jgi:hypothetical protein